MGWDFDGYFSNDRWNLMEKISTAKKSITKMGKPLVFRFHDSHRDDPVFLCIAMDSGHKRHPSTRSHHFNVISGIDFAVMQFIVFTKGPG